MMDVHRHPIRVAVVGVGSSVGTTMVDWIATPHFYGTR